MPYTARVNQQKQNAVSALANHLRGVMSCVFTDYRGATVPQITEIRSALYGMGATYKVIKNRFAIRAFQNVPESPIGTPAIDQISHALRGPTAIVSMKEHTHAVLKYLVSNEISFPVVLKGAIIDGTFHDKEAIRAMATLPSREELLAKLLGVLQGVVRQFPAVLHQIVGAPVRTLQAVADKKAAE